MEVNKISAEAFEKAMKTLGLVKEESKEIEKAEEVVDAEKVKLENELKDTLKKAEELQNKLDGKVEEKKEEVAAPAVESELVKGLEAKVLAFTDVVGKQIEEKEELKKSIDDLLKKIEGYDAFQKALEDRLAKVSKQPMDRKSVSGAVGAVERFEKGEDNKIEKGFRTLNLNDKKDRAELADVVFNASIKDGKIADQEFAKAVPCIEMGSLGSTLPENQKLSRRLKEEYKIVVVKN